MKLLTKVVFVAGALNSLLPAGRFRTIRHLITMPHYYERWRERWKEAVVAYFR